MSLCSQVFRRSFWGMCKSFGQVKRRSHRPDLCLGFYRWSASLAPHWVPWPWHAFCSHNVSHISWLMHLVYLSFLGYPSLLPFTGCTLKCKCRSPDIAFRISKKAHTCYDYARSLPALILHIRNLQISLGMSPFRNLNGALGLPTVHAPCEVLLPAIDCAAGAHRFRYG